ncbi:hypothetical protein Pelo_5594 [Pelomyxa schiedti]|nr:hypothetical protein Pelo_5594 [Pelomyxa schiedti]
MPACGIPQGNEVIALLMYEVLSTYEECADLRRMKEFGPKIESLILKYKIGDKEIQQSSDSTLPLPETNTTVVQQDTQAPPYVPHPFIPPPPFPPPGYGPHNSY